MPLIDISDDKSRLDVIKIHHFLTCESSWAKGISLATVSTSIEHSVCIGAYRGEEQIGFCRIITDHATFANLVDVIVWPAFRGQGISKRLLDAVLSHRSVKQVRRFTLATTDAHGLYKKFGFTSLSNANTLMEIYKPDIYR
ncbi:N-acetyltransferase [Psychromonas marina]|uniref:N-acetyltransferase n=1 Tax=Psychromonas marina TaxID=88364 RepID=A0ABQ6E4C1_9GAMM|nr:GNAT family N-acetyltransferase [Psychromonas marina]GLS92048.1 N-acetyltransferase [Psychromonas marina]